MNTGSQTDLHSPEPDGVPYRCVCGEQVLLHPRSGGTCTLCDRHYSAQVLQQANAETASLASLEVAADAAAIERGVPLGERLGHFRVESLIGAGGMGCVYQAVDESLQRYVALKVITTARRTPGDTDQWTQLQQEARAQARVNHPNVVHIYFVGSSGEHPFLAMERVHGPTVADRLAEGPLKFVEVVELALQVAGALEHVARFDLVHGDIKPSNVLLADGRTAKVSDFGLARRLTEMDSQAATGGTPNYVSPEATHGRPLDPRSDMYSLGVTLFEMTFGRLPYSFEDASVQSRIKMHREAPVEFPEVWPAELPHAWRDLLERLMAKSPDDRYADWAEVIQELEQLKPVALPRAGRVVRSLAWLIDMGLVAGMHALLRSPIVAVMDAAPARSLRYRLADESLLVAILVGASILQARWRMTPGKKLFQIRAVDRHGLQPGGPTMAARMVSQMALIWIGVVFRMIDSLRFTIGQATGWEPPGGLVGLLVAVAVLLVLADAACAVFRRDGRSLHDLMFGTQVVLDARPLSAPR